MPFIVPVIIAFAASTALSITLQMLLPKPKIGGLLDQSSNIQQSIRQSDKPRDVVYGTVVRGGTLTGYQEDSTHIWAVYTFTGMGTGAVAAPIDGFDGVFFDDVAVTYNGSGDGTGTWLGKLHMEFNLGTNTQSAFAGFVADKPSYWTSAHKQLGCAGLYIKITKDATVYPNGMPNVRAQIRGKKLLDTRTGTTAFSRNSALAAYDYLTWPVFGLGVPTADVPTALVNTAANVSDEAVTVAYPSAGTQNRYETEGAFDTSSDKATIMQGLTGAMAGDCVFVGSEWRLYAGAWVAPTDPDVTESDMASDVTVASLASITETFNAVNGRYLSPLNAYQPSTYPTMSNPTYETADGEQMVKGADLPFTTDPIRAERIAKLLLEQSRRWVTIAFSLKLRRLNLSVPDVISVTLPDFGFTSKTFKVTQSKLNIQQNGQDHPPTFLIDIQARELDATAFAWSTADEIIPGSP